MASETNAPETIAVPALAATLTPLAALLRRENNSLSSNNPLKTPLSSRGGTQSHSHFGDPTAELNALLYSVGLCDLGFRIRISVTGEDKFRWLNGMVTNAVTTLAEGHGNYNFILNAQGRIQGDAYIFKEQSRLVVETDRSQAPHLMEHFNRFIIMDDVELAEAASTALGLAGPGAIQLLTRLGFAEATSLGPLQFKSTSICGVPVTVVHAYSPLVPRFELWFEPAQTAMLWHILTAAGARPCGFAAQDALRILEGTPLYGIDIHERNLVQETSQTRALNFTKGCYLGQEIVERIRSRTTVNRFLRQFSLTGAVPAPPTDQGIELYSPGDDRPAGSLTSIANYALPGLPLTVALGYIRREVLDGNLAIEYEGGTAHLLASPLAIPASDS